MSLLARTFAAFLSVLLPGAAVADLVRLPAGTKVYAELDEEVTSRKRDTTVGDIVRAHAWRNVSIDGRVVIKAGAPLVARVSHVKKARIAGRKGQLELEAVSARGVDGTDILLDGGYDKSGHGRKALSISLAAVVAWPLVFIKGKQAVLEAGTVFDASVQADCDVRVEGEPLPRIRLASGPDLEVEVLYDDMDPEAKQQLLPVRLRLCDGELEKASIVTVNDKEVPPIPVALGTPEAEGTCQTAGGTIDLRVLGEHFRRGINRFEIEAGGSRTEIVLDIEL